MILTVSYNDYDRNAEWHPINAKSGDTIVVKTEMHRIFVQQQLDRYGKKDVRVEFREPTMQELMEPRLRSF